MIENSEKSEPFAGPLPALLAPDPANLLQPS
jgi:hypothetical protein